MNQFFRRLFMSINTLVIHLSRGRIGGQLGSQTVLLLHTTGRKSGRHLITPIAYFFTGDFYFLVGSNWGLDQNAGWYYNLLARPQTIIEVRGRPIQVEASPASGAEYDRLWKYATDHHPPYLHYQEMTQRMIPIIILKPIG